MSTNDGGPAFPTHLEDQYIDSPHGGKELASSYGFQSRPGMTIRQYAAIHLRVPNSGTPWLDEMIREAQRNEFAGQALISLAPQDVPWTSTARYSFVAADAMLAACERKAADASPADQPKT